MATEKGAVDVIGVAASVDLSSAAAQYKVIAADGDYASSGDDTCLGVLQNLPPSGYRAALGWIGAMKGRAGGAITAGAKVTVTSGWLTAAASGDPSYGKLANPDGSAAASGDLAQFILNFANGAHIS